MKIVTTIGLVFCFYVFLGLTLARQGQAEEYYKYKDPHGNLVISNKPPPTGSTVLRKYELPVAPEQESPQPKQGADPQPNERSESSPEPPKSKIRRD